MMVPLSDNLNFCFIDTLVTNKEISEDVFFYNVLSIDCLLKKTTSKDTEIGYFIISVEVE